MSIPLTILGIPGSLRTRSYSRAALMAAARLLPPDVQLLIFDLQGLSIRGRGQHADDSACIADLKRCIRSADAVLMAAPEYMYGMTSVLDNAIELASQPLIDNAWAGKPVASIGASQSSHGVARAQLHLQHSLLELRMLPVAQEPVLIGSAHQAFTPEGDLVDPALRDQVRRLMQDLVTLARTQGRFSTEATPETMLVAGSAGAQTARATVATNEHSYKTHSQRRT